MKSLILGLIISAATPAWAIIWLNDPSSEAIQSQIQYKRTMILEPSILKTVAEESRFRQLEEVGMSFQRLLDVLRYSNTRTSPPNTIENAWWDLGILTKYRGVPESLAMDALIQASSHINKRSDSEVDAVVSFIQRAKRRWKKDGVLAYNRELLSLNCEALLARNVIANPKAR